jgi:hypothetical protein
MIPKKRDGGVLSLMMNIVQKKNAFGIAIP